MALIISVSCVSTLKQYDWDGAIHQKLETMLSSIVFEFPALVPTRVGSLSAGLLGMVKSFGSVYVMRITLCAIGIV